MRGEPLLALELRSDPDVFLARQRAREVAAAVGLTDQDQVRVATAVSEVGRDVLAAGGGRVEFTAQVGASLVVELVTRGRGPLADTGTTAARRLVDLVEVGADDVGRPVVALTKHLPAAQRWSPSAVREQLSAAEPSTPLGELRAQNCELADALAETSAKQAQLEQLNRELEQLNRELEQTNRGVVALYAELDERSEQLHAANEAKTRFLASVSHELRTPVNSVLGLARLLLDPDADPLTQEQRDEVGLVRASAQDLLGLVNELLDLAKAESGRLEPSLQPVDLRALWEQLRGTMAPLVPPGVELVVEAPGPEVLPEVTTDPALLRHVLRNLLSNALKFTERGTVRASTRARGDRLVIEVVDTGIGIAEADQTRVFEEFYQVRGPLQSRSRGTGLGLPYARRLVDLLGGTLRLDSAVGRGSTFTVDLPMAGTRAGGDAAPPGPALAAVPHVGLALVVDDDPLVRRMLRQELAGLADAVLEAADGTAALALLGERVPDVVFLDLRMPKLDGVAVLSAMRSQPALARVPVVMMTSAELPVGDRGGLSPVAATLSKGDLTSEGLGRVLARVAAR